VQETVRANINIEDGLKARQDLRNGVSKLRKELRRPEEGWDQLQSEN
jgi:hypothetical protein